MGSFFLTQNQDAICYIAESEIVYGYYELLPAVKWGDEVITPPTPVGRDGKVFVKKALVYKGCLPTSPERSVAEVHFEKPVSLEVLMKTWKAKLPVFEHEAVTKKKQLAENLFTVFGGTPISYNFLNVVKGV